MFSFNFRKYFGKFKRKKYYDKYFSRISKLEDILGYRINDPHYYIKALTHRSVLDKDEGFSKSNERLEYLGDAVLGLIVGEYLFEKFPEKGEGFLTKKRSQLVDKQALAFAAENIDLESLIFFKKTFVGNNTEGLKTIIADTFEALIGAIYLDKGLKEVHKFTLKYLIEPNYVSGEFKKDKNYKGQLLELTHSLKLTPPSYKIVDTKGPEHDKIFLCNVYIGDKIYGEGKGKSKKSAEQKAAKKALKMLNDEINSNE